MIPIAGSAYTYTYATMGELVAWIIGWDLILEYAFSNMSVSVGFAAHVVDLLDWLGIHLDPKWLSPAYLPLGLQDLAGKDIYAPGLALRLRHPRVLHRAVAYGACWCAGIRESARTNNIMVLVKIAAILMFVFFGLSFIHPANYHPFSPNGWSRRAGGRLDHLLHLHRVRLGFDGIGGVQEAAARCADRHHRDAGGLHDPVHRRGGGADRDGAVAVGRGGRRAGGECAEARVADARRRIGCTGCGWRCCFGAIVGMISSILVGQYGQARIWFAMSRDRLLPTAFSRVHPRFRTPAFATWVAGILVAIPAGLFDVGTLAEMSNIGTLFAFVLVSIGVHRAALSRTRSGTAAFVFRSGR